ncbi:uncharacterized protein LOC117652316 [Thrips palmi]|uniref:Uncharacterized protein LOC117652316 n=1 Tax=Thrips palmi TaxID=161013 RepID=A0A6P9A673_THRPL|nr:uncharacterized protein LOC117652316 [Thrips palmi]
MRAYLRCAVVALLACGAAVSSTFLDEAALSELAEREGYALTLHAVHRARRQADDQCRCPPPPPEGDEDMPPPPPPPPSPEGSSSEEGGRPPRPHGPPRGCWPPPPGPWGPHGHHHHHHRGGFEAHNAPACELRPLFRVPEKFNFTARVQCFERWEREQAKELGMAPEDRMDVTKYKPTQRKSLMWDKGCDTQCHFLELELLSGEDDALAIDAEAVAALLKEEGDSSDITAAVEQAVSQCLQAAAEMVHSKQVCRTGADEVLFCVQRTLDETCPGSKWMGQRSCDEVASVSSKLRACHMRRMMQHPHPPPFFDGRRGPPPHFMRPGGPGGPGVWPPPSGPATVAQPNTLPGDDSKSDA